MTTKKITVFDADGVEHILPTRKEVCPRCDGEGTHTNPDIDGNGLTAEDFADDPDFAEDYMRGAYDVRCECCGGANVVDVVDEDRLSPELLQLYRDDQEERAQIEAEIRAERRMGA